MDAKRLKRPGAVDRAPAVEADRTSRDLTESVESYLDGIYYLTRDTGETGSGEVATYMGVAPGSATVMVKRLAELGLVDHLPYRAIRLTESGLDVAKRLVRANRILRTFLAEELNLAWDEAIPLAAKLEHYVSDDVADRLHARLGRPATDPLGQLIDPDQPNPSMRLSDAMTGRLKVHHLGSDHQEFLATARTIGLLPGRSLRALGLKPADQKLQIEVETKLHTVSKDFARRVWVVRDY